MLAGDVTPIAGQVARVSACCTASSSGRTAAETHAGSLAALLATAEVMLGG